MASWTRHICWGSAHLGRRVQTRVVGHADQIHAARVRRGERSVAHPFHPGRRSHHGDGRNTMCSQSRRSRIRSSPNWKPLPDNAPRKQNLVRLRSRGWDLNRVGGSAVGHVLRVLRARRVLRRGQRPFHRRQRRLVDRPLRQSGRADTVSLVGRDGERTVRDPHTTRCIEIENRGWKDAVHVDAVSWTAPPSR